MTRTAKNPTGWHSEKKKIEVVTTYLAVGKAPMVEAITGVPRATIRQWKMKPWWKELVEEIRSEETLELDAKLRKIVDKSLDTVVDRLENGDFSRNPKTGKLSRTPVKMRDAERVASELIDKRNLIRKQPNEKQVTQQGFDDRLLKLAEQFAEFALGKREKTITIDGEFNAVHDQRETRLPEGIELGTQEEADSGKGSSISEQGKEYNGEKGGENSHKGEGYRPQISYIEGWADPNTQSNGTK